jgi:hypothetical protein
MLEQRWTRIHCHKNLKKNVLEKQNIRGVNLRRKLATFSIQGFPLPKGGGRYSSSNSGKVRVQADKKKNIKRINHCNPPAERINRWQVWRRE